MRVEIVNRNDETFTHHTVLPNIEFTSEIVGASTQLSEIEYSVGLTFLNFGIWLVWKS